MLFEESTSAVNECNKNACANPNALQMESQCCNQVSRQLQFFERSGQPRRVDRRRRFFQSVRCVAVHSARLLEAARLESTDTYARTSIACTNGNRYRLCSPSETVHKLVHKQRLNLHCLLSGRKLCRYIRLFYCRFEDFIRHDLRGHMCF